jgi:hypothetical protein
MVKGIKNEKVRKKIKRANKSVLLMHLKAYKGKVDSKMSEQECLSLLHRLMMTHVKREIDAKMASSVKQRNDIPFVNHVYESLLRETGDIQEVQS